MPTPAVFAMASRVTSAPSLAHARLEQPLTVAPGVGAHRSADGVRHRSSSRPNGYRARVAKRSLLRLDLPAYRRFLRFGGCRVRLEYPPLTHGSRIMTVTTPIVTPFKWETTAA